MFGHTMLQTLFLASVLCQRDLRGSRRKLQRGNSGARMLRRGNLGARIAAGFEVGSSANNRLYPFMARMVMDGAHKCGGSVISERIIATSRHCLKDCPCFAKQDWHLCPNICFIKLRETSDSKADTETIHTIEAVHLPRNSGAPGNFADYFSSDVTDFALVQLTKSVNDCEETSSSRDCWPISPVHLVGPETIIRKGDAARTIGWGASFYEDSSEFLQQLNLKINSNSKFEYIMETDITPDGGDACLGDSGGPLLIRNNKTYEWMLVATLLGGGHNCVTYEPLNPEQDKTGDWNKVTPHLNWIERVVSSTSTPTSTLTPAITGNSEHCPNGWTNFKSMCYLYNTNGMTWENAQAECVNVGANLVSITDSDVYAFVKSLTSDRNWYTFIGGYQKSKRWYWADGSSFSYAKWGPGQPDGSNQCALLHFSTRLWYDYPCNHVNSFVCSKAAHGWTDQDLEHINTTVQSFMTEHNVVGSSLALVTDGRLVYAKGFGVMDKDTREPVQSTSLFRIAGLSNPITSAAIMMLSERIPGLMERTVFGLGGILGTTYGTLPYSEYETQITIKHLLEHTAGGEAWRNSGRDPMFDRQHLTDDHDELIGWVLDTRDPSKKPSTEFAYSNFGFTVLGRVIEKLSGKSYESFVRDNILNHIGALGMKIGKSKKSERYPNEVTYHSSDSAYYPDLNIERMDATGGWISSAADYAQFLISFDGSSTKRDLITKSAYDLMTEGSSVKPGYAKGWSVNPKHDNIWHSGRLPGTCAFAVNVAKRQWGSFETSAVFIMNSDNGGDKIDPLLWKIQKGIKNWPKNMDLF